MDITTINKLRLINHRLYQTLAAEFSATRERLQPGVLRILEDIPPSFNLLDLGCGNGELALHLLENNHKGTYFGLDYSAPLLDIARSRLSNFSNEALESGHYHFLLTDLTGSEWISHVRTEMAHANISTWNTILAFAVLHHIPGEEMRRSLLAQIRSLLRPGNQFIHSVWQFLNSPRMRERILPWSEAGLDPEAVESDDYLLDWRRGGYAQRYVHHFSETELADLARSTGFEIANTFYSDGEGGNLGLYQVWSAININPAV